MPGPSVVPKVSVECTQPSIRSRTALWRCGRAATQVAVLVSGMEGAVDHIELLLTRQLDGAHRNRKPAPSVADTARLSMASSSVSRSNTFTLMWVTTWREVAIKQAGELPDPPFRRRAKGARDHREGIEIPSCEQAYGNGDRGHRSDHALVVAAVHQVGARCERLARPATARRVAGLLCRKRRSR